MWTRRSLLKASLAASVAWSASGSLSRALAEPVRATKGPRYFVTLFLRGGMDGVYTVDPKTRKDVEAKVDVPYEPSAILDAGGMQFGPHFAGFEPYASRMALVRGIQVKTANHETGAYQMLRMRTGVTPEMPSLGDIIGQHRDGQALASVTLGKISSFEHSPGAVVAPTGEGGTTSLDAIDKLSDEDLAMLSQSFKLHTERFPRWRPSAEAERTRDHVAQTAAFFEKLTRVPRFKKQKWAGGGSSAAEDLQRTLWFLEHDLARCVCVKIFHDWDSHFRNADKQVGATRSFVPHLARFLDELARRKNEHGTLAEQTLVVVGSELGRFPVINGNLGKDHFPETSLMFFGPAVNTGKAFGVTGRMMEGQKLSFATGMPDAGGRHLVLDDIGTTLLSIAGVDPALYGYGGDRLSFLERA